jgi:hypothetical protein
MTNILNNSSLNSFRCVCPVSMAKAKKKAAPKKEQPQEQPLKINGSFADVIGVAMGKKQDKKEEKPNNESGQ